MLPEPRLARQIIDVLGQSGTPLSKGVSYYNVGNESLLNAIDTHYLGSYLADGGAVFKLVVGDYGSGKSHFLYCVRDRAWQRDFAVSKVDLSPRKALTTTSAAFMGPWPPLSYGMNWEGWPKTSTAWGAS